MVTWECHILPTLSGNYKPAKLKSQLQPESVHAELVLSANYLEEHKALLYVRMLISAHTHKAP